jgi:hypothetical protein
MKIGKFVTTDHLELDNNDIALCIDKFQGTKLTFIETSEVLGRIYRQDLEPKKMSGSHNYWGTQFKKRYFTATPRNISCFVDKKVGKIETDTIFEYVEGSEGTIQYSASIKLFGSLRYKYQRNSIDGQIYGLYDYDTDLSELLKRTKEYYTKLLTEL